VVELIIRRVRAFEPTNQLLEEELKYVLWGVRTRESRTLMQYWEIGLESRLTLSSPAV
jgi:hypothetical protein